jgi:hypothetical protein
LLLLLLLFLYLFEAHTRHQPCRCPHLPYLTLPPVAGKRAPEELEWLWGNLHISPPLRVIRSALLNTPLVIVAFLFSVPTLLTLLNIDIKKIDQSPAFSWLARDLGAIHPLARQLLSTFVPSLIIVIANNVMFALLDLTSKCVHLCFLHCRPCVKLCDWQI